MNTSTTAQLGCQSSPETEALTYDEKIEMLRMADDIAGGEISEFDQTQSEVLIRALRLAADGHAKTPADGLVIVPIEPTLAQHIAAMEFALAHMESYGVTALSPFTDYPPLRETTAGMYRAMVGAANSDTSTPGNTK